MQGSKTAGHNHDPVSNGLYSCVPIYGDYLGIEFTPQIGRVRVKLIYYLVLGMGSVVRPMPSFLKIFLSTSLSITVACT